MLSSIKQRLDREDEGFTLIELMVVVLIIAILLAIAIPTFLGARNTANARAAQSNLRNGLTAEQTYYTNNNQTFDTAGSGVQAIEPALQFSSTGPVAAGNNVLVAGDTNSDAVILTAAGKDGNCYSVEVINVPAAATKSAAGTYYNEVKTPAGGCTTPSAGVDGLGATPTQASASAGLGTWSLGW